MFQLIFLSLCAAVLLNRSSVSAASVSSSHSSTCIYVDTEGLTIIARLTINGYSLCPSFGTCCPSGWRCNYRRGIPLCGDPSVPYVNGWSDEPCANPSLTSCDVIGSPDFCCPIGTVCKHIDGQKTVYCINPYGVTSTALPSAAPTSAFPAPSASAVSATDVDVTYSPTSAWNVTESNSACTLSKTLHVSDNANATISFSYTGPGVVVHTVTSPNGGVFSVLIDDFNTTAYIDTYSAPGKPECYALQFPPIPVVPSGYESHENHSISLVYMGRSPLAPGSDDGQTIIQFDTFTLPIYSHAEMTSGGQKSLKSHCSRGAVLSLMLTILMTALVTVL